MTPDSDLTVVHRAGRIAALQTSLALAAVLLVVAVVVFLVDVRVQDQQIRTQLTSVASTADDASDPPPGMIVVLRTQSGMAAASRDGVPTADLLGRPHGFFDTRIDDVHYRGVVIGRQEGTVVALLDLQPFETGRSRLLLSLSIAELTGILASFGVVILLTRRSIRPLTRALALQRRFVADASHELRAPLTVLHTRIQLLSRRVDDGDAHKVKEQVDALMADTRALGEVIEDLLASAAMTTQTVPRDRVDVSAIAGAVLDSTSAHTAAARVRLDLQVECDGDGTAGDFVVLGSASALRRAIISLVDNALTHQHTGGTITIRVGRHGSAVTVDVRDDGVGIDPHVMGTLFTRFSHGDSRTRTAGPRRYGIGLALVREIAHVHDGEIVVAQTPGGGATFRLTIPAAALV